MSASNEISQDKVTEADKRRQLVLGYFASIRPEAWDGLTPLDLVSHVENLHARLTRLGPAETRQGRELEQLKEEYLAEVPVLGRRIEGMETTVYELLLNIASGVEHFVIPPLSFNMPIPPREVIHI